MTKYMCHGAINEGCQVKALNLPFTHCNYKKY